MSSLLTSIGSDPRKLLFVSTLTMVGGAVAAYTLLRPWSRRRDAPKGVNGAKLEKHFRDMREAHIKKARSKSKSKKAAAAAPADASKSSDDDTIIRAPTAADVEAISQQTHTSFNSFNESVGLPLEFPTIELTRWVMQDCFEHDVGLVAVTKDGEILGSVFNQECDINGGAVGCGPWSAKWALTQQGIGRRLVQEIVATSIRHGAKSIRLMQISANLTSYSLYTSLGFVSREMVSVWEFFLSDDAITEAIKEGVKEGYTTRRMVEADLITCDALHKDALGITRVVTLTNSVRDQSPTAEVHLVVLNQYGKIIGYNTGMSVVSHSMVACPIATRFLLATALVAWKPQHVSDGEIPFVHSFSRLYPELERWMLNSGARLHRVNNHMCLGEWQPIQAEKYTYCSSITY